MTINNSKYGRALQLAAREAYENEIVNTCMVSNSIGVGKEWETEDDFMEDKIAVWLEESKKERKT